MLYFILFILTVYCILIISFIVGFNRIKIFESNKINPINTFSIIIPFRNEAENLPELLKSLSNINYPKNLFEILFVDDDSTDNSVEIIQQVRNLKTTIIKNKRKSNSPKKDAIETAINQATYKWIVTTDADCTVPKKWLQTFNNFIETTTTKMICAPVTFTSNNSLLQQFQLIDFMSLIGATIGGFGIKKPFLNNGANLCYLKESFFLVEGFKGNNTISSGDDIFLLEKMMKNFYNEVHFLKSFDALVTTKPEKTLKKLISQRVRWASKTSSYNNLFGKIVGVFVLLINFVFVALFLLIILKLIVWQTVFFVFLTKFLIDFWLIAKSTEFTKQSKNLRFYSIIALIHPFFTVFVGLLSILKIKFYWKNREVSV